MKINLDNIDIDYIVDDFYWYDDVDIFINSNIGYRIEVDIILRNQYAS